MPSSKTLALSTLMAGSVIAADSLASIKHVVLFMQENRAFNTYFGTMAGTRGFRDPNVQINAGNVPVFDQLSDSNETSYLKPWYLNYAGGEAFKATQCMDAGSNGYQENHAAYSDGLNNHWARNNTPWSWGYFKRSDVPIHFAIAEGWTVGDMYQESVITSTNPNRVAWISGSVNVPGGPQTPDQGGVVFDNNETPGCEAPNLNCYPTWWKTAPEFYSDAGVSWQLYQDTDNFDDNPLAWFGQFQQAKVGSDMYNRGMAYTGLQAFYDAAANGTLPEVSYIIGPAELSEHPPYQPKDGAWLQKKVVDAVTNSPKYNETVLIISYDETGGWGDHVVPYHSPEGTKGEWMKDPYGLFGEIFSGPGFRLPFYIISPWTRGGNVFVENADHISQIKFIEEWQAARGKNVISTQVPEWRRNHMSDLTKAFDFANPDYSVPSIPEAETPSVDSNGNYNGYAICQATYATQRPIVPYTNQTAHNTMETEQGFKQVRGALTEGRYLTFESRGFALTSGHISTSATIALAKKLTTSAASAKHNSQTQRWVLHQSTAGVNQYLLSSVSNGMYLQNSGYFTSNKNKASVLVVNDLGNGKGYVLQDQASGRYWSVQKSGVVGLVDAMPKTGFSVFSVTYDN